MHINRHSIVVPILLTIVQIAIAAGDPGAEQTLTAATPTGSDTTLKISHLHLSIWPEFDDPRVLVTLRGEMAPSDAFPTHITLPLPKGAEIVGAGMVSEQNELLLHPHRIIPGDDQDTLDLNLPSPRFFLEFYYNPLAPGVEQQFTYSLLSAYAIDRLEVDIQQPRHATNFTIEPQPMRHTTDEQGLHYAWFVYQHLQPHDKPTFHISYTQAVPGPSVARPPSPPDVVRQPRSPLPSTLLAFGILVGVAVVGSACVWLFSVYQRRHPKPLVAPPAAPQDSQPRATTTANFCSNCGGKLKPEHRFCPACGRQLD